jgi:orotate phosphoribosyltransferase
VQHAMKAARVKRALVEVHLVGLQLLNAQHVGPLTREPTKKAFARCTSQTVCVEADDSQEKPASDKSTRYDIEMRTTPIPLKAYKKQFLELALELGVLRFGQFTLKSGRVSPYFFNAGLFNSGYAVAKLGRCYASAIAALDLPFDMLFGPAYKGIPLVVLSAAALADHYDKDYPFAFNRKEAKDHGEGGTIVGAPLAGRVLILDDVITAGTAIREVLEIVRGAGAAPAGVLVALDREEVAPKSKISAVQQLQNELGVPIRSIVTLTDLIDHLEEDKDYAEHLPAVRAYRNRYGIPLEA